MREIKLRIASSAGGEASLARCGGGYCRKGEPHASNARAVTVGKMGRNSSTRNQSIWSSCSLHANMCTGVVPTIYKNYTLQLQFHW